MSTTNNERILIETEQRSKSNCKRIDNLEEEIKEIKSEQKAIYEIASSVKVLVERVGYIEESVEKTGRKVDAQTEEWRKAEAKLSQRIADNKTEPDRQIAENVNHVKLAVITAFFTALATGLITMLLH